MNSSEFGGWAEALEPLEPLEIGIFSQPEMVSLSEKRQLDTIGNDQFEQQKCCVILGGGY